VIAQKVTHGTKKTEQRSRLREDPGLHVGDTVDHGVASKPIEMVDPA